VTFGYSATGYPTRVSAGGVLLQELRSTDAFGRPADERYHGDGVRTRRSYDPGHGRLTRIETGTPGALRSIQDLETIWRTTGSLHQRLDRRSAASAADDVLDTSVTTRWSGSRARPRAGPLRERSTSAMRPMAIPPASPVRSAVTST